LTDGCSETFCLWRETKDWGPPAIPARRMSFRACGDAPMAVAGKARRSCRREGDSIEAPPAIVVRRTAVSRQAEDQPGCGQEIR
jgi:hypothetical protein